MALTIHLEVVTPNGLAVGAEVDQAEAQGVEGEFGVLPGHLPFLVALKPGVLRYRTAGKVLAMACQAGFAEAGPDKLTVLTPEAVAGTDVDLAVARTTRDDAQQKLDALKGEPSPEADELTRVRDWFQAQLEAARESGRAV